MRRPTLPGLLLPLLLPLVLAACAGYGVGALRPGEADLDAVLRAMGPPAMEWQDADGRRQLAYPYSPWGVHTFMAHIGPDGRLERIENVLTPEHFARIVPGMSTAEVLRLLGPVDPAHGIAHFPRRNELAWEWRYCDDWQRRARFNVLFDATTGKVRSTMALIDFDCERFGRNACWCSR